MKCYWKIKEIVTIRHKKITFISELYFERKGPGDCCLNGQALFENAKKFKLDCRFSIESKWLDYRFNTNAYLQGIIEWKGKGAVMRTRWYPEKIVKVDSMEGALKDVVPNSKDSRNTI